MLYSALKISRIFSVLLLFLLCHPIDFWNVFIWNFESFPTSLPHPLKPFFIVLKGDNSNTMKKQTTNIFTYLQKQMGYYSHNGLAPGLSWEPLTDWGLMIQLHPEPSTLPESLNMSCLANSLLSHDWLTSEKATRASFCLWNSCCD